MKYLLTLLLIIFVSCEQTTSVNNTEKKADTLIVKKDTVKKDTIKLDTIKK